MQWLLSSIREQHSLIWSSDKQFFLCHSLQLKLILHNLVCCTLYLAPLKAVYLYSGKLCSNTIIPPNYLKSGQLTNQRTSTLNHPSSCPCHNWKTPCYDYDLDLPATEAYYKLQSSARLLQLSKWISIKNGCSWWHQCLDRLSVVSGDWHRGPPNAVRKKNYTALARKILSTRHQIRQWWEILEKKWERKMSMPMILFHILCNPGS